MVNLYELDRLEEYLKENKIKYERDDDNSIVELPGGMSYREDRHQIWVPARVGAKWDALIGSGSYGYEHGLLEIYGDLVDVKRDGDLVAGWLHADDVIKRLEEHNERIQENL